MEEKVNLVAVPFDMELAKRITKGEIPGYIKYVESGCIEDCRIVCFDKRGDYPIIALWGNQLKDFETHGLFNSNGESAFAELQLRIPKLLTYKEGDIIYGEVDNGGGDYCKWMGIVKEIDCILGKPHVLSYVDYIWDSSYNCGGLEYMAYSDNFDLIRLATEEEEARFAKRLQEDNSEESKKILKQFFVIEEDENVTESKQDSECKFQPFDKVLVRDDKQRIWRIEFFGFILDDEDYKYRCLFDSYRYCIPYNENTKHLLGTTDNWEEEQ